MMQGNNQSNSKGCTSLQGIYVIIFKSRARLTPKKNGHNQM